MTTRPSRTRSLIGGIVMLVVMLVGLIVMTGLGRFAFGRGPVGWFLVVWVFIGLIGAGLSFFNAIGRGGLSGDFSLPEVDLRSNTSSISCANCGSRVQPGDTICGSCGAALR